MARKIRMGMIGGGRDSFIGAVHRMAAALDGHIELVCGAFSSTAEKSKLSGADLYLDPTRVYGDFEEMIQAERQLPIGERMDFVSIVTPNYMHFAPAKRALESGFHVICDKPLCMNLSEANELVELVKATDLLFAVTHNYTGYPMVKQAKEMIANNELGQIRKVIVEYSQGWLTTALESDGQKQASWRTDPAKSGKGGALGDIGTHAENLIEYVSGLSISSVCADVTTMVQNRKLDDDANILLRFENGAKGVLSVSQIAAGEENNLTIKLFGDKGGLEWRQMEPNSLFIKWLDKPSQIFRTGSAVLYPLAKVHVRLPAGHPEGFIEAFANIYRNFAFCIQARLENEVVQDFYNDYPKIVDGFRGLRFVEKVIEASDGSNEWTFIN